MTHSNDIIPIGLCQCGCGQATKISSHTYRERGHVKGEPVRFVKGHWHKEGPFYVVDEATGCWEWQRAKDRRGYGKVREDRTLQEAHRVYYERVHGPIPEGLVIDHRCRNHGCVNPDHLEPVTQAKNVQRGIHVKLTETNAARIRSLAGTMKVVDIAREFDVTPSLVSNIIAGRVWRHT